MRATRVEAQRKHSQDRAAIFERGDVVVVVVADGAGGTSGGTEAAERVIHAVEHASAVLDAAAWSRLLQTVGTELNDVGQTTAVVLATDGAVVVGASVGDSGALLVRASGVVELTEGQPRKPLLGGGPVAPKTFSAPLHAGDTLLLATDGLLNYASVDSIAAASHSCDALVELVRLPSGGLQDDVGIALVRLSTQP